jgi:hypothetical protein
MQTNTRIKRLQHEALGHPDPVRLEFDRGIFIFLWGMFVAGCVVGFTFSGAHAPQQTEHRFVAVPPAAGGAEEPLRDLTY